MREDALPQWQTVWPRCEYHIEEVPSQGWRTVTRIVAVPDSEVTWYEPIKAGNFKIIGSYLNRPGSTRPSSKQNEDAPKRAYQACAPKGDEWPAWLALARLDVNSDAAIEEFCSRYGLLGLRNIPKWKKQAPPFEIPDLVGDLPNRHDKWYDAPAPKKKPTNWDDQKTHCEPLKIFQRAVLEYQAVVGRVLKINAGRKELEKVSDPAQVEKVKERLYSIALDAQLNGLNFLLLDGCIPSPVYDKEKARWILGWQTRSLLDACYFSLILTLIQQDHAGLKACARCDKPFLAVTDNDVYCSIRHRKQRTVSKVANRQVKAWLRDKRKAGEISKEVWKLAHAKTEELYGKKGNPNRIKDEDRLKAAIEAFLQEIGGFTRGKDTGGRKKRKKTRQGRRPDHDRLNRMAGKEQLSADRFVRDEG